MANGRSAKVKVKVTGQGSMSSQVNIVKVMFIEKANVKVKYIGKVKVKVIVNDKVRSR